MVNEWSLGLGRSRTVGGAGRWDDEKYARIDSILGGSIAECSELTVHVLMHACIQNISTDSGFWSELCRLILNKSRTAAGELNRR
jgi:hypothetical protein